MDSDNKIGKKEAIYFLLILIINQIILNIPKTIIQTTSTGSILNLIEVGFLAFIISIIIYKCFIFVNVMGICFLIMQRKSPWTFSLIKRIQTLTK